MTEQPFEEKDVLHRFMIPPMDERERMCSNMAKEYVVVRYLHAPWGVTTYGRFGDTDEWQTPCHDMPVVANLLRTAMDIKEQLHDSQQEKAELLRQFQQAQAEIRNLREQLAKANEIRK
jgi:hypothetical protein